MWLESGDGSRFVDTLLVTNAVAIHGIGNRPGTWDMLSGPRFLLMDEPLASLDQARRQEIMGLIERVRDALGLPILYVSHDALEVARLADRVLRMSASDAAVACGSP